MDQLKEHTERVMERWQQEVSRLPFPAHYKVLDGDVLATMEELTGALFGCLEDEGMRREFEPSGKYYRYGEDLGRLRNQGDFTMQELVQEHLIYRNEFWGYFRETVVMKHVVDYQLEKEINNCFDAILQASAKAYQSEYSREIRENPLRDPLTGLYNADYFKGRLVEETRRSVRYDHELSLILFEMENYFDVQASEGGERLKEMMRFIAEHLERLCRDCDVIARVSDGGFALLLPETGLRGGRIVAGRLSRYLLLELPAMTSGEAAPVLRWGLASYPSEVTDPDKLYDCAREAMIQAHYEAPDEVVVYRPLASPGELSMAVKLIADVHSGIGGIGDQVGPEDTLLVLGDVLGLIDWADFTGILPEVLGQDNLRDMLYQAFAAGAEAARNLKEILLSPRNEYYESLRSRVEDDYREFRQAMEETRCRALVLFGNSDIPDAMRDVFEGSDHVRMVEGTQEIEGQIFGFLPGSIRSPFDMPGESDDDYIRGRLESLGKVDVLCAHIPPELDELTFDVVAGRNVLGSAAMLDYIREHQPVRVYHGHVHQPAQRTFDIGSTRLVNVGYYKRQRYVHVHGE